MLAWSVCEAFEPPSRYSFWQLWPSFGDCFRLLHRRSLQRCTDCPADARVHAHLSGAVHLMNYYRDVSLWHEDHLGSRAMLLGIKPTVLASLTTSLGMASLAISQLAPVKEFGIYSAISLSIATVFLLLGFPSISGLALQERLCKASLSTKDQTKTNQQMILPSIPYESPC